MQERGMRKTFLTAATVLLLASPAASYNDIPASGPIADLYVKAKSGDPDAQYNLAEDYKNGTGVQEDMKEALKWYHHSAMQGDTDAQFALGFVYRGGGGIEMNKVLSYMWFDLASKGGNPRAFDLRNDVAWSMTQYEISEARKLVSEWKPGKDDPDYDDAGGE